MDTTIRLLELGDMDKAAKVMQAGISTTLAHKRGAATTYDVFEEWDQTYKEVSARVDRVAATGFAGVPSGFQTLDTITGGMQPGWLGIVAARLGQGKTWAGIRMGFAASMTGHKLLYYSLEQNRHQIAMRLHSFASHKYGQYTFNSLDLNRGHGFDLREYKKFLRDLKEKIGDGRFYINDSSRGSITPSIIGAEIERGKYDMAIIDYMTLLGTTSDDWRGTARLSAELQSICQNTGTPMLAASQVNRLGVGKEPPGAEHLSQADAIGQDADLVMTMAQRSKHVMKMKLAKFRHGPTGAAWYCRFSPGTGQFDEITGDEAADQEEHDKEVD